MNDQDTASGGYMVLARKYRPSHFRDLIGQEAMVRTLTNAFRLGRVAQAYVLTGVRGIGKTTTARIIAKGLNCLSSDGPTADPCGTCPACKTIGAGRHVEVIEMDAASNTGVDYIREINEAVRYRPADVRYKVYIIDEVHMLSTSSFNALLKTLEEPPDHVVFVLATTEIHKVPVTVLSRCQRFDLRRVEPEAMTAHLAAVAEAEGGAIAPDALALIVRAAEGSVRDALSLLDGAISPGAEAPTTAAEVRAMLGLADRARVIDLFEAVMRGDAAGALAELSRQYAEGVDPGAVLRDLAELAHWVSVLRISEAAADDPTVSPEERARGRDLAERLPMPVLTRAWQMLLKSLEELAIAPTAMMAAEMALIRLAYAADLPTPGDLVRRLGAEGGGGPARGTSPPSGQAGSPGGPAARTALVGMAGGAAAVQAAPAPADQTDPRLAAYPAFEDVTALLGGQREVRLLSQIETHVSLVAYRPGVIEFHPVARAPADLAARLGQKLTALTGARWSVAVTDAPGAPTLADLRAAAAAEAAARAVEDPVVSAVLAEFPGAELRRVRRIEPAAPPEPDEGVLAPVPERDEIDGDLVDSDDDPFEET